MDAPPIFVTVADAAAYLSVAKTTVYRLLDCGRLPYYQIGTGSGGKRIDRADLLAYVEAARRGEAAKPAKVKKPARVRRPAFRSEFLDT